MIRGAASARPTAAGKPRATRPQSVAASVAGLGAGIPDITSTDPSGIPVPTGNLPGWTQEFADDFSANENTPIGSFTNCNWSTSSCSGLPATDAKRWFAYPDGASATSGHGTYEPSQDVSIQKNLMNINMHTDPATGVPGVDAVEPKIGGKDGLGQLYGTFSVRFRTSSSQGYSLAFLLWPDDNVWPEHSEVDFPETDDQLGGDATAFMHWMGATSGDQQDVFTSDTTTTAWHTYTIEWTPAMVRFLIDGNTIGTSTHHLPTVPMHWVLQTSTNLGGVAPLASASANIQIAWVTAYSMK